MVAGTAGAVALALLGTACDSPEKEASAQVPATQAATTEPPAAPATAAPPDTTPAAAPASGSPEAELVAGGAPKIEALIAALDSGDLEASHAALEAYDAVWNGIEVYVNVRSLSLYLKLEADLQIAIEEGLASDAPDFVALKAAAEELAARYADAITLSEQGPPLNSLFDDVTRLRIIRADLRITNAALDAGDLEKASEYFAKFAEGFNDAYPLLKMRNEANAEDTEHAVDDAVAAFADPATTAEDVAPLTAAVLSSYNFGVSLWNAAARNSNDSRTDLSTSDLLRLTQLHDVRIQLLKSLAAWEAGDFERAASVAEVAGTTAFDRVRPALAATGADTALKGLIDDYTALAVATGDAGEVADANLVAVRGVAVAEQALFGQFWTGAEVQDYVAGLPAVDPLT